MHPDLACCHEPNKLLLSSDACNGSIGEHPGKGQATKMPERLEWVIDAQYL
jgi:hypothetical protein